MSTDAAPGDPDHQPIPTPNPLTEEQRTSGLQALLDRHASQLGEHFTSVQINATFLDPAGLSQRFSGGSGDFFARYGVTRLWLKKNELEANEI